ncbi:MAG: hypothetical protein C0410_07990 [Anaerolinea sp.]|nr:hypothetical protein [Anaerolinea sp.]
MKSKIHSLIDINTADEKQLVSELKINLRLAKRIIAFRPYKTIDLLNQVWGIDTLTLERIQNLIKVESDVPVEPTTLTAQSAETELSTEQVEILPSVIEPEVPTTNSEFISPSSIFDESPHQKEPVERKEKDKANSTLNLALFFIILIGAFFRFSGINWDQNTHQNPDERFLTQVADQIRLEKNLGAYFDTAHSSMNPINYGTYTYGMLPLFITRITAEVFHQTTFDQLTLVGRTISAVFDLLALWMIYLLAKMLYNKKTGVLAAGLYAAAVLPIQMAHYFTVDSFCTVFVILAIYLALKAIQIKNPNFRLDWQKLVYFGLFGLVVGMAGACKINALPVFAVIILASIIHFFTVRKQRGLATQIGILAAGLLLAAICVFFAFRVLQPYAFTGTGFLGSELNKRWLEIIKEVTNQVAGFSEWPPNHHWTDRPLSYAWVNMVLWGMGIPLGIAGWAGWGWSAWRMWKGEWRCHILPFTWILVYFIWQNMQFWRYMRYFLIIYPFLIMFAAWALIEIFEKTKESRQALTQFKFQFRHPFLGLKSIWKGLSAFALIGIVLLFTYGYAFGFSRIYSRPITRMAASTWIVENIQGPLNLKVDTANGQDSYPISIIHRWTLEPGDEPEISIYPSTNGTVQSVTSEDIRQVGVNIYFGISKQENGDEMVVDGRLPVADDDASTSLEIRFGSITLLKDTPYYFRYKVTNSSTYSLSDVTLQYDENENPKIPLIWDTINQTAGSTEAVLKIIPLEDVRLNRLKINNFEQTFNLTQTSIKVSLLKDGDEANPLSSATQTLTFDQPGISLTPTFVMPEVEISKGSVYQVRYEIIEGGPVRIFAEPFALETTWDDAIPFAIRHFDTLGGIYQPLNFELYEADTPEKRDKMIDILSKTEYLVIPSNRCYDAMPRLPNRYPLTTKYYQELFDCPGCIGNALENKAYELNTPFTSPLGFELVATFVSNPGIGPFQINDQTADESFTVYDHPKVFIFKKTDNFSVENVKALLYSVDLDNVLFQSPMSYTKAPTAMQLPELKLAAQTIGGTWSAMFNRLSSVNTSQTFGTIVWYLVLFILGLLVFPLVFTVFSGLLDRGYPLARMAALLLTAWVSWLLSSLNILPFTRWSILLAITLLVAISVYFGLRKKADLIQYFKLSWKYLLSVEIIFAIAFVFMLLIRINNPDLWQPWRGGEKPMDFAFFNAVLKSVYFPPENPWFSGHYLNYYYYGFVMAAIPTKLIGIVPSIAYNLILPSWYAMTGIGIFCIGFNMVTGLSHSNGLYGHFPFTSWSATTHIEKVARKWAYFAGVFAMLAVILFGNLYENKIFFRHLPDMVPANWVEENPNNPSGGKLIGAWDVLIGKSELPGDNGEWYFEASRPILNGKEDTPIAEFPYFTYLYGDMHPHMLTMLYYALAFGWMLSLLMYPITRMKWPERILGICVAAIIFGSFSASHTWDFYPFLGLGVLTLIWSIWQSKPGPIRETIKIVTGFVIAFVVLAVLFYAPFSHWFKTEYMSIEFWKGAKTPLADYIVVYGLSLFIMVSLLVKESAGDLRSAYRKWPDNTTVTKIVVLISLVLIYLVSTLIWKSGYQVFRLALFLLIGLGYQIFFKRGQSKLHKITWILYSLGLLLTLLVEVVVLKGDTGRANMVFRMYIEAWFYFGLSSCLALTILLSGIKKWPQWASIPWLTILVLLVFGSLSYPYFATGERLTDRWPGIADPPKTLDGTAFILGESDGSAPAIYDDDGKPVNLSHDYYAIQFMQDNILGSPVIVEGNTTEYKWGSRFSVHTGLPSVVGWSWHTRQHNSLISGELITKRIDEVAEFYNTVDLDSAKKFLAKYDVQYIIVGDLERVHYSTEGLAKFQNLINEGTLIIVFGDNTANTTTIFEVTRK